jgi:streptogramin lyase
MFRQSVRMRSVHQSRPCLERLEERCLLTINEFPTPTPGSTPYDITVGPDGNLWFSESSANKIGQVTPGGSFNEYPILTPNADPSCITAGPDGNLWFTESGTNQIGRITPNGTNVTQFKIPTSNSNPGRFISGDGSLWFVEQYADQIGKVDPATGSITQFHADVSVGSALSFGPDGNLWFTGGESYNTIGVVSPRDLSQVTYLPIPTPESGPVGITVGSDGNLWFTEWSANKIANINPKNYSVHEFPIPTLNSYPQLITNGPDGNLWFTEIVGDKIGQITTSGSFQEFPVPTGGSGPLSITVGPDFNIWFTEIYANKIGQYILTLPASHLLISAASSSTTGVPFGFTVTALDNVNRIVPGYAGTVHFTSSDPQATLPADYTFTATDNGVHTFANGVTLNTPGTQAVTATDTASGITGSATITVSLPPPDHFALSAPAAVVAGSPFDVTVTAITTQGAVAIGYTGTVSFTSSDLYPGMLPATYTFTSSDQGVHTFTGGVTLFTAGTQTLTVQDTTDSSIAGSAAITVSASSASSLLLAAPPTAVAGSAFNVTVTALDPYGNVAIGYTGTVTLTSSDRNPQPSDYTFTPSDSGMHTFGLTLDTAAPQTLSAWDAANSSIRGSATVVVGAAKAIDFLVTAPGTAVAGTPFDVIVTALDLFGNTVTNYQGTVTFSSSDKDPRVVLPANYTFTVGNDGDNGVHTFPSEVTLITPGLQLVFATDTVSGAEGAAGVTVGGGGGGAALPPGGGGAKPSGPSWIPDPTPAASVRPALQAALVDHVFRALPEPSPVPIAALLKRSKQSEEDGWLPAIFQADFRAFRL